MAGSECEEGGFGRWVLVLVIDRSSCSAAVKRSCPDSTSQRRRVAMTTA